MLFTIVFGFVAMAGFAAITAILQGEE